MVPNFVGKRGAPSIQCIHILYNKYSSVIYTSGLYSVYIEIGDKDALQDYHQNCDKYVSWDFRQAGLGEPGNTESGK